MNVRRRLSPVLVAFVDGLKYDSIARMPFLSSLPHRRRLRTDLGYSITCHATMYSGVYPQKHGMWFMWKYSPETSPFRWLPESQLLRWIDSLPTRYATGKMTRLFSGNSSYAGIATMKRSALRNWHYFDLAESKLWDEPGYLGAIPTVFDILREKGIAWQAVGLFDLTQDGGSLSHTESYHVPQEIPSWTYLFIGDVDHVSHFHTQGSEEARKVLRKVDAQIARVFQEMKVRLGQEPLFFCFSDHGHMHVKHKFDIYEHLASQGLRLDDYIHIVDTNFARFWFRNTSEEHRIRQAMESVPSGFFLTEEHLAKYHTLMPDNRYGDAIYYLDAPYMFQKTVWGYGLRTVSIHGYLPDHPEKDGVFVSNIPIAKKGHIELVDILPSLLSLLNVKVDYQFDGVSVW